MRMKITSPGGTSGHILFEIGDHACALYKRDAMAIGRFINHVNEHDTAYSPAYTLTIGGGDE